MKKCKPNVVNALPKERKKKNNFTLVHLPDKLVSVKHAWFNALRLSGLNFQSGMNYFSFNRENTVEVGSTFLNLKHVSYSFAFFQERKEKYVIT